MLYAVAFRWTEVTGGENGLGGITRPSRRAASISTMPPPITTGWSPPSPSWCLILLWRFHNSTVGTCWWRSARTSSARASSATPPTATSSLAFVLSAAHHRARRHAAAVQEPHDLGRSDLGRILRRIAGDGRDRRHAQLPGARARRAVLHPVPRLPVGIYTENWLLWFGLVFVGFIVFSPTGLVGVYERLIAPFRKKTTEDAAMSARRRRSVCRCRNSCGPKSHVEGPVLSARGHRQELRRHPGGARHDSRSTTAPCTR